MGVPPVHGDGTQGRAVTPVNPQDALLQEQARLREERAARARVRRALRMPRLRPRPA